MVWVSWRYTVSMLCSDGSGSVFTVSTLGLRMVSMYGWTSREKLRVCFFSIPLRSVVRHERLQKSTFRSAVGPCVLYNDVCAHTFVCGMLCTFAVQKWCDETVCHRLPSELFGFFRLGVIFQPCHCLGFLCNRNKSTCCLHFS